MAYYGSWKLNDLLTFTANTHNASTGSAVDADAVPLFHVYEDETATPLVTGTMALLNGTNTVGYYSEQITLSAANGFEKGKSYNIYIQAVVGSVTGTMAHNFQLEAEVDMNTASTNVTAGMVTGSVLGNVNGSVGSVVGNVGGSVGSVTNPVTSGNVTGSVLGNVNGSVGSVIGNVGGSVGSVVNPVTVGNVTGSVLGNVNGSVGSVVGAVGSVTGNVGGSVGSVLAPVTAGMVTGSVLGNINGSVNNVVQPVGISTGTFISAIADGVWDETNSEHLLVGSVGYTLFSRMPSGTVVVGDKTGYFLGTPQVYNLIGNVSGTITTVLNVTNPVVSSSVTGNVGGSVGSVVASVTAGNVTGSVLGNVNGSVGSVTNPVGISTGSFINAMADQVWDEAIAQHLAAGSTGLALNSAGGAGDPWSTSLPGAYGAGTAGQILASRMPTGTVLVGDKTGFSLSSPQNFNLVGNISGTFTGNLSGSVGSVTDMGATLLNKLADFVLRRSFASAKASSNGDSVVFRSLMGVVAKLTNRWNIAGTTLTIYEEDDSTPFETQTLTGTPGADPITQIDTD